MTWLLRGLALVFALGAIIAGLIGYRLSTQPPPPAAPAPPPATAVQTLKPVAAGIPIRADDVGLVQVAAKPAGSYGEPAQVIGQRPATSLAAGEILTSAHFPSQGSHVQRQLAPGERAVAIKVDEVVGLGGFAEPGDQVDVLFYLRGTQETANASSAQVVLSGVRLLAFGEALQPAPGGSEGAAGLATEKIAGRSRPATSAVLAVPEDAAARLMLAANSGTLRLALRPADAATRVAEAPHLVHLAELAQAARPMPAAPAPAPKARRREAAVILVHEGDAIRTVGAPR
ncbi:MAG TPA: Flp pilus assembly protein CpaB [Rhodocyclaceae bacterium]|nr:Flp pilus assembly protein CpaB [Rhodocyclaceae bacterium]